MDGRCLFDEVDQTINIASSMPSQVHAEMVGNSQYETIHMMPVEVVWVCLERGCKNSSFVVHSRDHDVNSKVEG